MAAGDFEKALEGAREIEITVTGRGSGRQIRVPIWFVEDHRSLYLLPVRGADADWYQNLVKNPTVSLTAAEAELTTKVSPITDPARASDVVDRFRAKYGSADVTAYYTNPNVAVEVPLG